MSQTISEHASALTEVDRAEIMALFARYTVAEDNGDATLYASLFTSDGGFVGGGDKSVRGRGALEAFAVDRWENRRNVRGYIHWSSNISINATASGCATALSYQMSVEKRGDEYEITKVSGKSDTLRREDGRWLFQERRVVHVTALTHESL